MQSSTFNRTRNHLQCQETRTTVQFFAWIWRRLGELLYRREDRLSKSGHLACLQVLFVVLCSYEVGFAQPMNKCVEPNGKIIYSDIACSGDNVPRSISNGTVTGIGAIPAHEIKRFKEQEAREQQARYTPAPPSVVGQRAPTAQEIKNMETSASSIQLSDREKAALQVRIGEARQMRGHTAQEIKNMETSASSMTVGVREGLVRQAQISAARQSLTGESRKPYYFDVEAYDARSAQRRQEAAAFASKAAQQAAKDAQPVWITKCQGSKCTDSSGNTYRQRGDSNDFLQGTRTCRKVRDQMFCN